MDSLSDRQNALGRGSCLAIVYTPAELTQRANQPCLRQLLAEGKTLSPQARSKPRGIF
jgi:hypothetical protein